VLMTDFSYESDLAARDIGPVFALALLNL